MAGFVLSGGTGQGRGRGARAMKAQTGTETFDRLVDELLLPVRAPEEP